MKAFGFFAFMLVGTSVLLALMTGGGGMASTQLAVAIDSDDTTITVDSNAAFASSGLVWIDDEQIAYSSKTGDTVLNVSSRGYNGTKPTSHDIDDWLRTEDNAELNRAYGFNVGQLFDSWGLFAFPIIVVKFFTNTIPAMIQGNVGGLFGSQLSLLVDFWLVFGSGFVFMLVMALINARRA